MSRDFSGGKVETFRSKSLGGKVTSEAQGLPITKEHCIPKDQSEFSMTGLVLSMRVGFAFFDSSRIESAVSCVIVHKTLDPSCMSNCSAVCSGMIRTELKMNVQHASVWIQRAQYASIILRIGVVRRILKKTDGGEQFPSTRMMTMLPAYIYSSVRSTCRPQQPPGHAALTWAAD